MVFGSIVAVRVINNFIYKIYQFEGLSTDFASLQAATIPEMQTGSSCFLYDTGKLYKYVMSNNTWYEVPDRVGEIEDALDELIGG